MNISKIILASSSKFRADLLRSTGVDFQAKTAPIDEHAIQSDDPRELALMRADRKALAVSNIEAQSLVIGCDQVLAFEGKAYGKADSESQAFERLRMFSGKGHELLSAYVLYYEGRLLEKKVVGVPMKMRDLSDHEITAYLATEEWRGCAGCYQYENRGGLLFEPSSQSCDFSAIVGLPVRDLNRSLLSLGVNILTTPKGPWSLS